MNRGALRRVAGPLVLVVAVVALLVSLRGMGSDARDALRHTSVAALAGAFVAALAGLLASAQVWRVLLADLGSPLPQRPAQHIFFVGQLGKYIPGSVFAMTSQVRLGRSHGVPRTRAAASWLLFMVVLVASGVLCAAVALPLTSPHALDDRAWVLLLLPVGLACLSPPLLNRLVQLALAKGRRDPLERPLTWAGVGAAGVWALVMWACYGAHLALLIQAQDPEPGHQIALMAFGGFALAWVVGLLVIVAPAGAGAREAVLIVVLAPVLSVPEATAVALVSRLLLTLGDGAWAGIALLRRSRSDGAASHRPPQPG